MKARIYPAWFWGMASFGLSTFSFISYQPHTLAISLAGTCSIPQSNTTDKPYNSLDVEQSFLNSDCTATVLQQDTTFYRYYSFPPSPIANIGRYLTTNFFDLNSEAIVQLALYPFPPNIQFQNFAYNRETVFVKAGTTLYSGIAGPQPYDRPDSCYSGGASQYFFTGDNISSNPDLTFNFDDELTRDTRYPNQYGVGDPCQQRIPEPSPLTGIGALALFGLAAGLNRTLPRPKTKPLINNRSR